MNSKIAPLLFLVIATPPLCSQSVPWTEYLYRRFHPPSVKVSEVQGLPERISDGKLHLDVKSFLELVLKNSTEVQLTRLDVYLAADQIIAVKAPFDPVLGAGFNTLRAVLPQSNQISGAQTLSSLTQNSTLAYQQVLPTGQTINAGFAATRSSTNSQFFFLNPSIFGALNFSITQPLFQNRSKIQFYGPLKIARTQLVISSELSQAHIADIIALAAAQYWDAIRARDNIRLQQQTVALAQKSYERDKRALDLGALAEIDIYQSETQVAERNRDLIQSQFAYQTAINGLRRLIGADMTAEMRKTEIVLEDDPSFAPPRSTVASFEESLAKAMQIRPELNAAHRRFYLDDLNARIAQNLLQPRVDLAVQGGSSGLGGNTVPVTGIFGAPAVPISGGLGDALGQSAAFTYPSYGFGLQLTLPFRNSAAQGALSDALVNKVRDRYQERQIRQQIILEVRQAIHAIDLADASIEASRVARDLALKNVEAEQEKYELGSITVFELLDSQNRLASTETALLGAYVGYQQAYISYQRATWTLLDGLGMVLEMPTVN
jgi:outer membrane protein